MRRTSSAVIKLLKLAGPLTPMLLFSAFSGAVSSLSVPAIFLLGAYGIEKLLYGNPLILWSVFGGMLVLALVRGVFRYTEQYTGHYVAFRLLAKLRDQVFTAMRRLAPAKLEARNSGELVSTVTGDIELIEVFYAHTIGPVLIGVTVSTVMTIVLWMIHPVFGMIGLAAYLTLGCVIPIINYQHEKDKGTAMRRIAGQFHHLQLDIFSGIRDIRLFGRKKLYEQKLMNMEQELSHEEIQLGKNAFFLRGLGESGLLFFTFAILFAGTILVSSGILVGSSVLYAAIAFFASSAPVLALNQLGNGLIPAFAACRRVVQLIEELPAVKEAASGYEPSTFEDVELGQVDFGYDDQPEILKAIDFHLDKGDKIGLSGASGSGKSTLLKLIMRFWDPTHGEVMLNGEPMTLIQTRALRVIEGASLQDAFLFNQSIADNIRIGNPNATDEEVATAAEQVNLKQMIDRLPHGFETKVGELGDRLSTGERQRLALARLFVRDSDLILLDEPTSNVDRLNEHMILRALDERFEGKSMLIVSHRRSALNHTDAVYAMEQGRLKKIR
ncbi:ABC transporter ATP-binding protein/permease [Sporolactobacillus shoreicorticis]|uniref:Amino acid ABC transporter ATP-binding/permease protein n=1 Tax=Sporolactobacillus shoreicorticis TaxID=1923877 RepID=A0ABW5S5S4_9BACL|nr:ABC transporter ATP-binding protein [Sporolactobacillus shoreicorticis]MCO7127550.1 ABC transporter ATP-binding protein/permease [Sporolactobacillus shoreicorticis]